jgi:hypothetical protein
LPASVEVSCVIVKTKTRSKNSSSVLTRCGWSAPDACSLGDVTLDGTSWRQPELTEGFAHHEDSAPDVNKAFTTRAFLTSGARFTS